MSIETPRKDITRNLQCRQVGGEFLSSARLDEQRENLTSISTGIMAHCPDYVELFNILSVSILAVMFNCLYVCIMYILMVFISEVSELLELTGPSG